MDVRLPNGTIIRGVPEGTSAREIRAIAVNKGLARTEDFPSEAPIDVQANRNAAIKQFGESLPWYERLGIGAREPILQAATRINSALGMDTKDQEQALSYSRNVGGAVANVGRMLPAVATLGRVPGAVLPQALAGGAYGAMTGEDPISGAIGGTAGGAAGSVAGGIIGRGANAVAGKWAERAVQGSDDAAQTLRDFQAMGGRLLPSQASGSAVKGQIDEALANNPITSSAYNAIAKHNETLVTRTAAKALGITSNDIGPSALRAADDVLTKQFDAVASKLQAVPVSAAMADDIVGILSKRTGERFAPELKTGAVTGRTYMDLRSELLSLTRSGGDKADDAWDLIDDLDTVVNNVAPPGYKEIYAAARERYKTLLSIDKYRRAVTGGQVNAKTLEGAVRSIFKKQYTRDLPTVMPETKDMFTSLRAMADPRMASLVGGSPTAKRMLPYAAPIIAGGLTGDPLTGAAALGGMYVAPRAALAAPANDLLRALSGAAGAGVGSQ